MFDIIFHINLFISLIELERLLNTSNKRTVIVLPIISLTEVEDPLKSSNKRTQIGSPIYFFNWSRTSIKNIKQKEHKCKFKSFKTVN